MSNWTVKLSTMSDLEEGDSELNTTSTTTANETASEQPRTKRKYVRRAAQASNEADLLKCENCNYTTRQESRMARHVLTHSRAKR
jgi:hypothetical protein